MVGELAVTKQTLDESVRTGQGQGIMSFHLTNDGCAPINAAQLFMEPIETVNVFIYLETITTVTFFLSGDAYNIDVLFTWKRLVH